MAKTEQPNLFADIMLPDGGTVKDNTDITTFILYFSTDESIEIRKLLKTGVKKMYKEEANQRGNVSDFVLELVKRYVYEDYKGEKTLD